MVIFNIIVVRDIRLRIANFMSTQTPTIRVLEEQTNHFFLTDEHFNLKQTVAQIETFLLLFNPFTKYDLCRYWQMLEIKGYDPVVEYSKGLELFDMHYSPSSDELFTIVLQISRFLKEFSDFETRRTPDFRHPYIKGKVIQIDKKASRIKSEEVSEIKKPKPTIKDFLAQNSSIISGQDDYKHSNNSVEKADYPFEDSFSSEEEPRETEEFSDPNQLNFLKDIGLDKEIKLLKMSEAAMKKLRKPHESKIISVPRAKLEFIDYFRALVKQRKTTKKLYQEDESKPCYFYDDDEDKKKMHSLAELEMESMKEATNPVEFDTRLDKAIHEISLNIDQIVPPSYYYYKRWVWMMFPWACLQTNPIFNYSDLINQCYSSQLRYLSGEEDRLLTEYTINIVRITKEKKLAVFSKEPEEMESKLKVTPLVLKKKSNNSNSSRNLPKLKASESGLFTSRKLTKISRKASESRNRSAANSSLHLPKLGHSINNTVMLSSRVSTKKNADMVPMNKFNFFENIKTDKVKIKKYLDQSQALGEENPYSIDAVLSKSKFWEGRLASYDISEDLKERLLQSKTQKSLFTLRNHLNEHTKKEFGVLERKKKDLVIELNRTEARINEQQIEIARLQSSLKNMPLTNKEDDDEDEEVLLNIQNNLEKIMLEAAKYESFGTRMERVLDVCEINKIQNEDWIRSLNFYKKNLEKVIKEILAELELLYSKERDILENDSNLRDEYNIRRLEHISLIDSLKEEIKRKKYVDALVLSTNAIINDSVYMRQREIETTMEAQLSMEEQVKSFKMNHRMKVRMFHDLDERREIFEANQELFMVGKNGEPWFAKQEMLKAIEYIESKRDLDYKKMNTLLKIEKAETLLDDSRRMLDTLTKANVGTISSSNTIEDLYKRKELIESQIKKEKRIIDESTELLSSTTIIDNSTNLLISSIGRSLGMVSYSEESNILSSTDAVYEVEVSY